MKNIGVGIVGAGFGCAVQVPGFRACEGVEVVALCSQRPERARAAAAELAIPFACSDYRELVRRPEVDLVSVVTPPDLHRPMALAALEAGKHVLCEKPMALDLAEAREMRDRAAQAGVVHVIDHETRFDPTRRRVRDLLAEGFAGRVYHATVHMATGHRAGPGGRTDDWWSEARRGGGALGATGSHVVDLLRFWLGEFAAVSGQLGTFVRERRMDAPPSSYPVTSDDQCAFLAELESGVVASVFITAMVRHPTGLRVEIQGEEGTLVLDADDRLWGRRGGDAQPRELTVPDPNRGTSGLPATVWAVSFVGLARHVAHCLRTGSPLWPAASFDDGVRAQAVLDAVRLSWAERRWVPVAPGTSGIAGPQRS